MVDNTVLSCSWGEFEVIDTTIPTLGPLKIPSPIKRGEKGELRRSFVNDTDKVVMDVDLNHINEMIQEGQSLPAFELAGPRENLYFDPSKVRCDLVTCGGLCPGLNDIIRAIVLELFYGYGVKSIYGFKYGLQGFIPIESNVIEEVEPELVSQSEDPEKGSDN